MPARSTASGSLGKGFWMSPLPFLICLPARPATTRPVRVERCGTVRDLGFVRPEMERPSSPMPRRRRVWPSCYNSQASLSAAGSIDASAPHREARTRPCGGILQLGSEPLNGILIRYAPQDQQAGASQTYAALSQAELLSLMLFWVSARRRSSRPGSFAYAWFNCSETRLPSLTQETPQWLALRADARPPNPAHNLSLETGRAAADRGAGSVGSSAPAGSEAEHLVDLFATFPFKGIDMELERS